MPCSAGTFKLIPGESPCILCEAGKFNPDEASGNASMCQSCPDFSTSLPGSVSLDACECFAGFEQVDEECKGCALGKYKKDSGSERACLECPAGQYSDYAAGTICYECPAGKYSDTVGATTHQTCLQCSQGKYSELSGATSMSTCKACTSGKFSSEFAAKSVEVCKQCEQGAFSEVS